jgi:valyl-tRNA synthetase
VRKERELPNKDQIVLCVRAAEKSFDAEFLPVIVKLCNLSEIRFVDKKQEDAASFMVRTTEFYIPLEGKLDVKAELKKIKEELDYLRGFLASVMKKLDNERFVTNAPAAVIDLEKKKKSDAEMKIRALEEALKSLKK